MPDTNPGWTPVGEIVVTQIQRDRLTGGEPNVYRPDPLLPVEQLAVTSAGVLGALDGGWMLDVHHDDHPGGHRFTPDRALSFGFTSHYDAMADRFGAAPPGIAGENVIVSAERIVTQADLAGGIRVSTSGGDVVFDGPKVAAPCAMFTRYLRGTPDAGFEEIADDRAFLHGGIRGFVMRLDRREGPAVVLRTGDPVAIRPAG